MYPGMSYNQPTDALDESYRLFLIPGAAHCALNDFQPDGPWPQTTLQTLIQWVEEGTAPDTLNGTGAIDTICRYPLRPLWSVNGSSFEHIFSQESSDSFTYTLHAFAVSVY
ncbi:hypothetical protein N7520_001178 [Penicillium odoratum]|uniref:uncharacterized protein n=1 Tax=Penicillium odoratum TaxID=1167516 RepID=UPI002549A3ED|nr:uncharacterized protein N7520_001178 [Penicillium odoratum]KAJ5777932.1 hypothetical protein N7520_001178 [Penicillium odoratum]